MRSGREGAGGLEDDVVVFDVVLPSNGELAKVVSSSSFAVVVVIVVEDDGNGGGGGRLSSHRLR